MATEESNNGLYFIVGALVVIVAILGFVFLGADNVPKIEPAAGMEQAADQVEETTSKFEVNIEEDGVSASSTQSE